MEDMEDSERVKDIVNPTQYNKVFVMRTKLFYIGKTIQEVETKEPRYDNIKTILTQIFHW